MPNRRAIAASLVGSAGEPGWVRWVVLGHQSPAGAGYRPTVGPLWMRAVARRLTVQEAPMTATRPDRVLAARAFITDRDVCLLE